MRLRTGMPASRAASGLEPSAYSSRPLPKCLRQYAVATSTARAIRASHGTAEMPPEPKSTKPPGRSAAVICREPTQMESMPRMM